jgi:predicted thioesterase
MSLEKGLRGLVRRVVRDEDTAVSLGSGTVPLLATPRLLALIEEAAVSAVEGKMPEGQTSVGIRVELEHVAATPVGMGVEAAAELITVDGRRLEFAVEARDEVEVVGRGRHERLLVEELRFVARAEQKRKKTRT